MQEPGALTDVREPGVAQKEMVISVHGNCASV